MTTFKTLTSNCCNKPVEVINGDEGTSYWQCTKCKNPCDGVSDFDRYLREKASNDLEHETNQALVGKYGFDS